MASQVYLIAIITPKPGKEDRVIDLFQAQSEIVKKNEPGTLKYEVNIETKPSGTKEIVMVEIYKDKAAFVAHASSKEMKALGTVLQSEDLLAGPMQLKKVKAIGGFSSRI